MDTAKDRQEQLDGPRTKKKITGSDISQKMYNQQTSAIGPLQSNATGGTACIHTIKNEFFIFELLLCLIRKQLGYPEMEKKLRKNISFSHYC